MVAVSTSAQLLTLPLTLYYFHQFPNYFILSNIIALPLASFVLYGSITALVIAPIKFLWLPVGWILKWLVFAMNSVLIWIEHLPGAVTTGIGITPIMAISLFIIVVAVRIFIFNKKVVLIYVILLSLITISGSVLFKKMRVGLSGEMSVLNTSGPVVIILREGLRSYVLTNDTSRNVDWFIKPYKEALLLSPPLKVLIGPDKEYRCADFSFYKGFIMFKGKKVYIWEQKPDFNQKIPVDLLVLAKVRKKESKEIQKYFSPGTILIKSDVFTPVANGVRNDLISEKLHCELLSTHGAWTLSLSKKNDK
jgi:competence protein ComEC